MVDSNARWCLFCDLEVHSSHQAGPYPILDDYADELVHRAATGQAFRIYENESRIARISDAHRTELPLGSKALAMVVTLGDRRGADPAFIHF